MKSAIDVRNISKKYRIGQAQPYYSLRDTIVSAVSNPLRLFQRHKIDKEALSRDEFWAIKELSFKVEQGEVIGIIGNNGAGKSTLLKILSRITPPTKGEARLSGRVASLLEIGTGFNPELTGRENVFLNGSILGMKQTEIKRKFKEIIDFAEIVKFLDMPVKHYSSGMYTRLAFSVAAHLDAEILLIDEVLAVGDTAFQKKCLGKMGDVAKLGRTIILVSHNMGAIKGLCQRVLWINEGMIKMDDISTKVITKYLNYVAEGFTQSKSQNDEDIIIKKVILKNSKGVKTLEFNSGDRLQIEIHYRSKHLIKKPNFWVGVVSKHGPMFGASMLFDGHCPQSINGDGKIICVFKSLPLLPQIYTIQMGIRSPDGVTLLTKTREVGFFNITGRMKEIGFKGEMADILSWESSPMIIPYEWHLPDGTVVSEQINNRSSEGSFI